MEIETTTDDLWYVLQAEREARTAQQEEIAALQRQVKALQARRTDDVTLEQARPVRPRRLSRRTSRRGMLKAALSATVATVGAGMLLERETDSALASATETKSASGVGNVAIEGNGTNSALGLVGTSGGTTGLSGFPSTGVMGYSHSANGYGVVGFADATFGYGVAGFGRGGSGIGVWGSSTDSYGVLGLGSVNSVVGVFATGGSYPTAAVVGDGGGIGRGVYGTSDFDAGVSGRGGTGGAGVFGHTSDGTGYGVHGHVTATGTGIFGESDTGIGGTFSGGAAPLLLTPAAGAGAPTSGPHNMGEIYVDSAGVFWVCVAGDGSNVGTWKSLTSVVPIPNVRVMNTRPGKQIGPYLGPIANNNTLALTLAGTNGIPANATGVIGNLTAADATAGCFLALVPSGANHVGVSSVNFPALAQGSGVANAFTVGLTNGAIDIYTGNCSSYSVNIIVDITGYIV